LVSSLNMKMIKLFGLYGKDTLTDNSFQDLILFPEFYENVTEILNNIYIFFNWIINNLGDGQ
jgi:hypothetical protein